jgi:serpin B
VLLLINAVYFKGKWTEQFDKTLTSAQEFYLPSGSVKQHPMMRRKADYRYYAGEGFQLANLPYGDGRVSMLVFLPARREPEEPTREQKGNVTSAYLAKAVSDLAERLTPANWQRWQDSMRTMEGDVVLPRFKLEYEKTLNKPLSDLGMEIAFDPARANFSRMLPAEIDMPFYISEVKHKSFVEVNEEGTEAAAVTSVKMTMTAMPVEKKTFTMTVDRPFLYAIVDHKSGAVLFLGAVFEPKQ